MKEISASGRLAKIASERDWELIKSHSSFTPGAYFGLYNQPVPWYLGYGDDSYYYLDEDYHREFCGGLRQPPDGVLLKILRDGVARVGVIDSTTAWTLTHNVDPRSAALCEFHLDYTPEYQYSDYKPPSACPGNEFIQLDAVYWS